MYFEYDYDDVLLVPKHSDIDSRDDVKLEIEYKKKNGAVEVRSPIFSAPMKGISEPILIELLGRAGGIGILHRFYETVDLRIANINNLNNLGIPFGVSVGLNELDLAVRLWNSFENIDFICVDIANGYLNKCLEFVDKLRKAGITNVIAGNVVTAQGYKDLINSGANYVRVGIGSGTQCLTRDVTGIGRPQLSSLSDCSRDKMGGFVISDGGISGSANAVKSFACGADYVMIGSLFGKATELNNSIIYGMASEYFQKSFYGKSKSIEGKVSEITGQSNFSDLYDRLLYGIKSACTYLGTNSQKGIKENARFVEIGRNTLKGGSNEK